MEGSSVIFAMRGLLSDCFSGIGCGTLPQARNTAA
jgi:hypothetical protein